MKIEKIAATDKTKVPDKAKNRKDTLVVGISKPGGVFLPYFQQNGWDGNVTSVILHLSYQPINKETNSRIS